MLAFLEGSDPEMKDEVIVITSHYDHVGIIEGEIHNGADDDGSGTVTVMELARQFVKMTEDRDLRPKRSVLFMNVVGEEKENHKELLPFNFGKVIKKVSGNLIIVDWHI